MPADRVPACRRNLGCVGCCFASLGDVVLREVREVGVDLEPERHDGQRGDRPPRGGHAVFLEGWVAEQEVGLPEGPRRDMEGASALPAPSPSSTGCQRSESASTAASPGFSPCRINKTCFTAPKPPRPQGPGPESVSKEIQKPKDVRIPSPNRTGRCSRRDGHGFLSRKIPRTGFSGTLIASRLLFHL